MRATLWLNSTNACNSEPLVKEHIYTYLQMCGVCVCAWCEWCVRACGGVCVRCVWCVWCVCVRACV